MGTGGESNEKVTRLLLSHRTTLFAYILACVRNHADAEEILQEVFVAVLASLPKLSHESESMPWAREIARRQVLSFFRKSRRPMMYDSEIVDLLAMTGDQVDSKYDGHLQREALRDCVEGLPPKSREILQLRYGGVTDGVEQIAQHLGRTMSATYGLIKRIRMALRGCVERKLAAGERYD